MNELGTGILEIIWERNLKWVLILKCMISLGIYKSMGRYDMDGKIIEGWECRITVGLRF